jgi:hypothetical protein
MAHVRTALSLEKDLFEEAEATARDLRLTRSGVWSLAMTEFLRRRSSRAMLEQINSAVDAMTEEEKTDGLSAIRRLHRRAVVDDQW